MNLNCETLSSYLSSYIDYELDEETTEQVKQHLAECEECRKEYEFLKGISETAKTLPKLSVSSSLHGKIMDSITEASEVAKKPKSLRKSLWKTASGFVAAAAVVAVSVISLNSLPGHPELTPENLTRETEKTASPVVTVSPESETAVNQSALEPKVAEKREVDKTEPSLAATEEKGAIAPLEPTQEPIRVVPPALIEEPKEEHAPAMTTSLYDESVPAIPTQEIVDQPEPDVASAGGGGGSARMLQMPVITYVLSLESYNEAVEILSGFEQNGEGYVVPQNEYSSVAEHLEGLNGYLRRSGEETATGNHSVYIVQIEVE